MRTGGAQPSSIHLSDPGQLGLPHSQGSVKLQNATSSGHSHVSVPVGEQSGEQATGHVATPVAATGGGQRARQLGADRKRLPFLVWAIVSLGALVVMVLWPFAQFNVKALRRMGKRTLYYYLRLLRSHPISTRMISAALIFFSADLLAQKMYSKTFSYLRLFRYTVYGLAVMGPFLCVWYNVMHVYGPPDTLIGSFQKAVFEQITLEPLCIAMYIVYDGIIARRGPRQIQRKLSAEFWHLWIKNGVFWVPSNFFNYYAGTPDLRVLISNICSLFWNVYFSAKINASPPPQKTKPAL